MEESSNKLSGVKRAGSKGMKVGGKKKSREDGELDSGTISEFNTPQMAASVPLCFRSLYEPNFQRMQRPWTIRH
ncbi:aldo-keto reductase [Corchorus olitorius]|uniref:Aldo-keto reductase n=1 Tax=Corchorus olitorius TaxID=93759 RepID=A0A1R3K9S1_9ROSI|nr:aldo-keto reductase [Corchorus olitorius]